jgi:COMPASS component SWD3
MHTPISSIYYGYLCSEYADSSISFLNGGADGVVKLWNVETGQCAGELKTENPIGLNDIAWSKDSKFLASASDEPIIVVWDVNNMTPIKKLSGHTHYVMSVDFSPSSDLKLASGSFDESVRMWDVKTGRCLRTLPAHTDPVTQVAFSRDGTLLASGSYDGLVRVWDSLSGQCLKTIVHEEDSTLIATAATGSAIASPNHAVSFLHWAPKGPYIFVSTLDNTLRLWHYTQDKSKCVKTYKGHKNEKYCIFSGIQTVNAKTFVFSGSEDHLVYVWDLQSREVVQKLSGHTDVVVALSCHPTLDIIATGALEHDKTVKIWYPFSLFFCLYLLLCVFCVFSVRVCVCVCV